jgi:hypothetical protein
MARKERGATDQVERKRKENEKKGNKGKCVTKRRKGETKEGGGNEAGNREAHAGNRADLATKENFECNLRSYSFCNSPAQS